MNNRIKQLAEQALPNIKYWNDELTKGIEAPKNRAVTVGELEKFAELIVRESAKIAAQDPLFLNYAENDKHMERDIINHSFKKIKKEFGIDR